MDDPTANTINGGSVPFDNAKVLEDVHKLALARFAISETAETHNRFHGVDDLKFLNGDQWPFKLRNERENANRPCETINKLPGHIDQIMGELRQNKLSIKVRPTGKPSSKEVANIIEGLVRNIERLSRSDIVYKTGAEGSLSSGRGAWRIITDFVDDDVFDQEARIMRIKNPYTVYFDPSAEEWDKRDGKYVFISEWVDEVEFRTLYPDKSITNFAKMGIGDSQKLWYNSKTKKIRVVEYFTKNPKKKVILLLSNGHVMDKEKWDELEPKLKSREKLYWTDPSTGIINEGVPPPQGSMMGGETGSTSQSTVVNPTPTIERSREVNSYEIVSYILGGTGVISGPHKWAGKYIPVVPCWGKEINIDGVDYIRGQVRFAKGPQRMYNYERNAEIERVALAKVPPVRITPEQIEGHQHMWDSEDNYKYQLYNHIPGQLPPIDTKPPQVSSGHVAQSSIAADEIKATTSVFDASLGARSNETSGVAIRERKVQGNIANYVYLDNLIRSICYTGEILVDLIPRIYDTERKIMILGEDGTESEVTINEGKGIDGSEIKNDLSIGKYSVSVSVGPHFETRRVETAQNLIELAGVVPTVGQVGGDIIIRNMDFVGSDELADRLFKLLPIELKNEGPVELPPPSPDDVQTQVETEGLQLDNEMKKMEIQKMSVEMRQFMQDIAKGAAAGAVHATLQKFGVISGKPKTPTGGVNTRV